MSANELLGGIQPQSQIPDENTLEHTVLCGSDSKYEKIQFIGNGASGTVYKIKLRRSEASDPFLVAKVVDLAILKRKQIKSAANELMCLANCDHYAIIKFFEYFRDDTTMILIMEYAGAGDLAGQIQQRKRTQLFYSEVDVLRLMIPLILAVHHVHKKRMLHRDIKPANVLLMQNTGLLKLSDFGFSKQYEETVSHAQEGTMCGTPYYQAPEVWTRSPYGKKADMWSLGVVMYELIALERPYPQQDLVQLLNTIKAGALSPLPDTATPDQKRVVSWLLQADPEKRPCTNALLRDPYILMGAREMLAQVQDPMLKEALTESVHTAMVTELTFVQAAECGESSPVGRTIGEPQSGPLMYFHRGEWHDRFVDCDPDAIAFTKPGESDASVKRLPYRDITAVFPVADVVMALPHVFCIVTMAGESVVLQASSDDERDAWMHGIYAALGLQWQ